MGDVEKRRDGYPTWYSPGVDTCTDPAIYAGWKPFDEGEPKDRVFDILSRATWISTLSRR